MKLSSAFAIIRKRFEAQGGTGEAGHVYHPTTGRVDVVGALAMHKGWSPEVRPGRRTPCGFVHYITEKSWSDANLLATKLLKRDPGAYYALYDHHTRDGALDVGTPAYAAFLRDLREAMRD